MKIICRHAEDDFRALLTAQGIENCGGVVFCITSDGSDTYSTALSPHTRFIVWGKLPDVISTDEMDASIDKELAGGA